MTRLLPWITGVTAGYVSTVWLGWPGVVVLAIGVAHGMITAHCVGRRRTAHVVVP